MAVDPRGGPPYHPPPLRASIAGLSLILLCGLAPIAEGKPSLPATVLGLNAPRSQRCRAMLVQLVRSQVAWVEPRQLGLGDPPSAEDDLAAEAWVAWVEARARKVKQPALVVIGEVLEGSTLRVDVLELPKVRRVAMKTMPLGKGCRLHPRLRIALAHSVYALSVAQPARLAGRGGGKADPVAAAPAPPPRPLPVPVRDHPDEPADPPEEDDFPLPEGLEDEIALAAPEEPAAASAPRRPSLFVEGGLRMSSRSFRYDQPATANLREYRFDLVPVPSIEVELAPLLALAPGGPLDPLWITARYGQAIGLSSRRSEGGTEFPTRYSELELEAGYGVEIQLPDRALRLSPRIGLLRTDFALSAAGGGEREGELPAVTYTSLLVGASLAVPVKDRIAIVGDGAYLGVLGTGPELRSTAYFPSASAHGVSLSAGLGLKLIDALEVRLSANYTRYFLSFTAVPGAARSAQGASDENLALSALLRLAAW